MVLSQAYLEWEQQTERRGELRDELRGELRGEQKLIFRLLTRRFGEVTPETRSQIQALSLAHLKSLGEALLDCSQPSDLLNWLQHNQ